MGRPLLLPQAEHVAQGSAGVTAKTMDGPLNLSGLHSCLDLRPTSNHKRVKL